MAKKEPNYRLRMVIMIILALIMVLIAAVCVLYRVWVVKPDLPATNTPGPVISDPGVVESGEVLDEPTYDPVQPKVSGERKSQDYYTILVFGTDESSNLTDTMMVVSYDVTNQKASVMSLPRDTLINISRSYKKLNGVYSWHGGGQAGIAALKNEVSELLGFTPDYFVQVNWDLVGQMVEAIGGVYFDVPLDMWYADPYQDLYIDLDAGYQLLNGDQAMQLVRWRKNMDPNTYEIVFAVGDVERLKIQQDFLKAVLKQTLQLKNVTRISQLAELFSENVVSDLAVENLFWFGSQAIMGGLSVDNVQFLTMPWVSGNDYNGTSYVYPIRNKLLTIINEQLNPFVENVTMSQLDLMMVNADGTLSSSTGVLADPSMGILPPEPSEDPEPNASEDPSGGNEDPVVSDDPVSSEDPAVTETPSIFQPDDPGPAASEEPAPSEAPAASEEPVNSEEPDFTPDETPAPEVTQEPTNETETNPGETNG